MSVSVGSSLPEVTFKAITGEGIANKTTGEIFSGKRVVLFAVPGAYTPTCQNSHLPGFLGNVDAFKAKGVDTVACTAVNDPFVLSAWAKSTDGVDKLLFLADGNGEFAKAAGLDIDLSIAGLGVRSKRYAMLVEDGIVRTLLVEDNPGKAEQSSADALLALL